MRQVRTRGGGVSFGEMSLNGSIEYVTESFSPPPTARLAAAVVWRGRPAAPTPRVDHEEHVRRMREEMERRRLAPPEEREWMSGGSPGQVVRVNLARRLLEVLGTRYPLPEGDRALVVLVDQRRADAPVVRTVEISAPAITRPDPPPDGTREERAQSVMRRAREEHEAWRATVRADPTVRAFLEDAHGG